MLVFASERTPRRILSSIVRLDAFGSRGFRTHSSIECIQSTLWSSLACTENETLYGGERGLMANKRLKLTVTPLADARVAPAA
jgi:hypothetical protein